MRVERDSGELCAGKDTVGNCARGIVRDPLQAIATSSALRHFLTVKPPTRASELHFQMRLLQAIAASSSRWRPVRHRRRPTTRLFDSPTLRNVEGPFSLLESFAHSGRTSALRSVPENEVSQRQQPSESRVESRALDARSQCVDRTHAGCRCEPLRRPDHLPVAQ